MAAVSSTQGPIDPWEQPQEFTPSSRRAPAVKSPVVDDWEDDVEDEREIKCEEDNKRIWEEANTKVPNPMPSLIISPSASSARSMISPPLGAFQPTMRILKRPSSTNSESPTPPPSSALSSNDSLKEREARYRAARERIFGAEDSRELSKTSIAAANSLPTQSGVPRQPKGPSDDNDGDSMDVPAKGFRHRRKESDSFSEATKGTKEPTG